MSNGVKLVVYSKQMLNRRFPGSHFFKIGEIGDMTRKNYYSLVRPLETDQKIKVYPIDTHLPIFDRKIGYVLLDYEYVATLYKSRIPKFIRNFLPHKELQEVPQKETII